MPPLTGVELTDPETPVNNDQDRRTFLAIVLSLGVYFIWTIFFAPPPPVPSSDIGSSVSGTPTSGSQVSSSGGSGTSSSVTTSFSEPTANQPAKIVQVTVRDHSVPMDANGWSGTVHSGNGSPRGLTLTTHTEAPTLLPVWSWIIGKFTGDETSEGGWEPYLGGELPQQLRLRLEDDGAGALARLATP